MIDKEREEKRKKQYCKRYKLLQMTVTLAMCGLVTRLLIVQIAEGDMYRQALTNRTVEELPVSAPRGIIYDSTGQVIAGNRLSYTLIYVPSLGGREAVNQITRLLSPLFQLSDEKMEVKMDISLHTQTSLMAPRRLFSQLTPRQIAFVHEHADELPGIQIIPEVVRQYPQGSAAAHILGYLNSIPPSEIATFQSKGYPVNEAVGVYGLEKQYEQVLHGGNGKVRVAENDPTGHKTSLSITPSRPGNNVQLNIRFDLQKRMEQALAEQILSINGNRKLHHVDHAAVVAMDPRTGNVLGIASYPGFDPNDWVGGISTSKYAAFQSAQQNWALQVPIPPGSTVKPLSVLLGLKSGKITPYTLVNDTGRLQVGWETNGDPHYLYCWNHAGHGRVDARRALAESCNVYMYQLSLWMGGYPPANVNRWLVRDLPKVLSAFQEMHQKFGLGIFTGIDLPEEINGSIHSNGILADLPYTAIGQSQAYTTLQLAQYVSTIANGGKRMEPHVVKEVTDPSGRILKKMQPRILNDTQTATAHLRVIQEGMRDAVRKPYGTAYSTFLGATYTVAGKTGTAETGIGEDNALFVGYAPYEQPEIAIAVIVPGGGHGADSSGPIARKVFDAYFSHLQNQEGKLHQSDE